MKITNSTKILAQLKLHGISDDKLMDFTGIEGPGSAQLREVFKEMSIEEVVHQINIFFDLDIKIGDTVIMSAKKGFWNDEFGWLADAAAATGFHSSALPARPQTDNTKDTCFIAYSELAM